MSTGSTAGLPTSYPPALLGTWDMFIDWEKPRRFLWNKTGRVQAKAAIGAHGKAIAMEVHSPGSDSTTRVADWSDRQIGKAALHYVYDVTPRAGALSEQRSYSGAAILRYDSQHDELRGNYWTSIRTTGEFTLVRPGREPVRASIREISVKRRGRYMFRAFGAIVVLLLLGTVLWFLLAPSGQPSQTQAQQDLEFAVKQASDTCLLSTSEQERRRIETGVASRLNDFAAKGEVTTERTRRAVNETFSEAGQIAQGRALQDCMLRNTEQFMKVIAPEKSLPAKAE